MHFSSSTTAEEALEGRDLTGQCYIITGANSGIGAEAVKVLAKAGARVVMTARNMNSAQALATSIKESGAKGSVAVKHCDLTDLASVRSCSKAIAAEEPRIDGLLLNAGIMVPPLARTKQGFESQIGTNHLGHFCFGQPLIEAMQKQRTPSRVVVVASEAHAFGKISLDDLNWETRSYSRIGAYGQSKLANMLYAKELSKRLEGTNVTAYSLHPGVVRTNLWRHMAPGVLGYVLFPLGLVMYPFTKSSAQGAATTVFLATQPGVEQQSGRYFSNCKLSKVQNKQAEDTELASKLWDLSAELVQRA